MQEQESPAPAPADEPSQVPILTWDGDAEDDRLELRARQLAFPVVLGGMLLLTRLPMVKGLVRIFLSMWLHEFGHALSALLCARPAFPLPWFTPVAEQRSWVLGLLLAAAFAAGAYWSSRLQKWGALATFVALLGVQGVGSVALSLERTETVILFAGDAGGLLLGTLFMALFYSPRESRLHQGWLRWGLLVIGAGAVADISRTWWAAHRDFAELPFGENEGMAKTDPLRLVEDHGWSETQLVSRYLALVFACAFVLAVLYGWGWVKAAAALRERPSVS